VPLGTHRIVSADPSPGAAASTFVTLSTADQVQRVQLVEGTARRGERLRASTVTAAAFVPGCRRCESVSAMASRLCAPSRPDPTGRYNFPGSPVGTFNVSATAMLIGGRTVNGQASGTLTGSIADCKCGHPIASARLLASESRPRRWHHARAEHPRRALGRRTGHRHERLGLPSRTFPFRATRFRPSLGTAASCAMASLSQRASRCAEPMRC
jgi:hypothetical protein